jgi:hypothetical protein
VCEDYENTTIFVEVYGGIPTKGKAVAMLTTAHRHAAAGHIKILKPKKIFSV